MSGSEFDASHYVPDSAAPAFTNEGFLPDNGKIIFLDTIVIRNQSLNDQSLKLKRISLCVCMV